MADSRNLFQDLSNEDEDTCDLATGESPFLVETEARNRNGSGTPVKNAEQRRRVTVPQGQQQRGITVRCVFRYSC